MTMDTSEFDLDKYLRASNRVDLSSVEWERIGEHPVTPAEARCLTYMMDIETHTVVFLRDLLATRASFDPEVTAFLSCWVYEELWHGEAFSRFLGEAGYRVAPTSRTSRETIRSPPASTGTNGSGRSSGRRDTSPTWARCSARRCSVISSPCT